MTLQTATVNVPSFFEKQSDKQIRLVFDSDSYICIHEEPIELQHDSDEENERHQSVSMMAFQEKVAMLLRAKLKSIGIQPPLSPSQYSVNITVATPRPKKDVPLLSVMKAILDGINVEIIDDDRNIYRCDIQYIQKTVYSKAPQYQSHDSLKIGIYDMASSSLTPIVEVGGDFYIVPKQTPIMRDGGDRLIIFNSLRYQELAVPLRQAMKIKPCGHYSVTMIFVGKTYNKDIDNMARTYYPILGELGISDEQVHTLHLEKRRDTTMSSIEIRIDCKTP
ncbi:hypothetical protein ACEF06_17185 [Brevibacillus agri]